MPGLILAGTRPSAGATLQADEYVDMALTFSTVDLGDQLVLTIDGETGGWLEMVLDVRDGSVVALTITSPLPRRGGDTDRGAGPSDRREAQAPLLEIDGLVESSERAGLSRILSLTCPLFESVRDGAKVVGFSAAAVSSVVGGAGVQFGFGAQDELVEIVIEADLLRSAQPF